MDRDEPSLGLGEFIGEDTEDEDSTDIIQGSLPECVGRVSEHLRSRRSFMGDAMKVGASAAALSALGAGSAAAEGNGDSGSGSSDVSDLDVLNYALTLEHLEATYYREFLDEYTEHEVERSDIAKYFARPTLRYSLYQQIEDIGSHEQQHVEALTATIKQLGGTPVEAASYTFPYDSLEGFAALSDRIESVGVSAYAGAAPLISDTDVLKAALSIHSVEANHSTFFNFLHLQRAAPNAFNPARDMDQVLGIVKPLITSQGQGGGGMQMFDVTVENVSKPGTLDTDRAKGAVPLSPGAWAAYTGSNPMFAVGQQANVGTERIAEDGFPGGPLPPESGGLADTVANADNVTDSGVFQSPGGSLPTPALGPGESAEFTVAANEGEYLQFETMFVQSNDWFYAFEGDGLELFPGSGAVSGDVTGHIALYDAGTEADTAPGTGPNQKPVQDPMATNVGPNDSVNKVELATDRHPDYDIPDTGDVIKVTITPQ